MVNPNIKRFLLFFIQEIQGVIISTKLGHQPNKAMTTLCSGI